MADTKVSDLTAATPIGTDYVYLVDDPGGTPSSKSATLADTLSSNGGWINALADGTVTGDGSTDDASAIETLIAAGGNIYFPTATYKIATTCNPNLTASVNVYCSPGAVFQASSLDGAMFEVDVASIFQLGFSWTGGIVNTAGQTNSSSALGKSDLGFLDIGTATNPNAFSFRDEYFASITVQGVSFFTKGSQHLADPKNAAQHWMGTLSTGAVSGGDSAIFANCGAGRVLIQNNIFAGFRDTAIYLSGTGSPSQMSNAQVLNNEFYWCVQGIAAKAGIVDGLIDGNYLYQCYKGIQLVPNDNGTGPTGFTVSNNTVTGYSTAYICQEADRNQFVNNRAIDGGPVDWNSDAFAASGSVTITGDADGATITGITVNSVQIMDGTTETQSGTGTAAVQALAEAVRDNINGHTSTPDFKASVIEDATAGDWIVQIFGATANDNSIGETVVSSGTATATDANMAQSFVAPKAIDIDGSTSTRVTDLFVDGTSAEWVADLPAQNKVIAVNITSIDTLNRTFGSGDLQTLDTTIDGLHVDSIEKIGGEVTTASVADPDRTKVRNVVCGDDLDDYTGFTLLGASSFCDYQETMRIVKSSDQAIDTTTTEDLDDLSFPVYASAVYRVTGMIVYDAEAADDLRLLWTVSGTESGYILGIGPSTSNSGISGNVKYDARAWSATAGKYGGIGTVDAGDILGIQIEGIVTTDTTGTIKARARLESDTSGTDATVYANSYLVVERIG